MSAGNASFPIDYLEECFRFDQEGNLYRKIRPRHHFPSQMSHSVANGKVKAAPCGTKGAHGYLITHLDGVLLRNHRVIFALANGYWPIEVDHID